MLLIVNSNINIYINININVLGPPAQSHRHEN